MRKANKNNSGELIQNVSGSVLCGGKSSRMGVDKMCVPLAGRPLLEHVLDQVQSVFAGVMISVRSGVPCTQKDLPVVRDVLQVESPLAGIHASLINAQGKNIVVAAVDMPLVQPALLRLLAEESAGVDVVVPKVGGFLEPLLAAYSPACIHQIEKTLAEENRRVVSFYDSVQVKILPEEQVRQADPGLISFCNINLKSDLKKVEQVLKTNNNQ